MESEGRPSSALALESTNEGTAAPAKTMLLEKKMGSRSKIETARETIGGINKTCAGMPNSVHPGQDS